MSDLQPEGAGGDAIEQKPTDAPIVETPAPTTEGAEAEAPKADAPKPEEQWPKKAVNAISKRDRQIGKLRAELEALRRQSEQSQGQNKPQASTAPQAKDFDDYESYIKAVARYEAKQEAEQSRQESLKSLEAQKQSEYVAELEHNFITQVNEAKAKFNDFDVVRAEAQEEIDALPPHIANVCLEAEDGVFALYQIAKEGKLNELANMSPIRAAQFIARMGDKAKAAASQPKPVTKAPQPVTPSKGTAAVGKKSLDRMGYDELREWLKS